MAGLVPAIRLFRIGSGREFTIVALDRVARARISRHCERSEAIQRLHGKALDCFVASDSSQ
jgi:hypothetical protein